MDSLQSRPNIMEMAKKKRHIYLLEKLRSAGTLSRAELGELAKFEPGSVPGYATTQEDLAAVFKVEPRTIRRWVKAGMPQEESGYNILDVQLWRDSRKSSSGNEETLELTKAEYKDQAVFGMRIGCMFFKEALLLNAGNISNQCFGKTRENVETIIKQEAENLLESLLNRDDLQLVDPEL